MKRALIVSLILGLIFSFGLGFAEAATTQMFLTIKPFPLDIGPINQESDINWIIDISRISSNPNIVIVTIF